MSAAPIQGAARALTPPEAAAGADLRAPVTPSTREQVRNLSHQLEAVFVNQLFQAMRATIPQGGPIGHAPGEEMFTSLMDEKLASETAARLQRGLGESLYRQLAKRLPDAPAAADTPRAPTSTPATPGGTP